LSVARDMEREVSFSCYPFNIIWEQFPTNKKMLTAQQVCEAVKRKHGRDFKIERMTDFLNLMVKDNYLSLVDDGDPRRYRLYQGDGVDYGKSFEPSGSVLNSGQKKWGANGIIRSAKRKQRGHNIPSEGTVQSEPQV